jgi:hypothetical protein
MSTTSEGRSALKALDLWFHHAFFGALDRDDRNVSHHKNAIGKELEEENNFQVMKDRFLTEIGMRNPILRSFEVSEIAHCQQLGSWDCGLACLIMISRWIKHELSVHNRSKSGCIKLDSLSSPLTSEEVLQRHHLLRKVNTESIWTIDLFMLLSEMLHNENGNISMNTNGSKISSMFVSRNLGVNKNYRGLNYYKQSFRQDERRVKRLFSQASSTNSCMVRVSNLNLDHIVDLVSMRNIIAIALVDNNILTKHTTKDGNSSGFFAGHFIILCGVSHKQNDLEKAIKHTDGENIDSCFVVKNPGSDCDTEFISLKVFLESWQSLGTDQDIIFIGCPFYK